MNKNTKTILPLRVKTPPSCRKYKTMSEKKKSASRGKKKKQGRDVVPPFTSHAVDKQVPWMAIAKDSAQLPRLHAEDDETAGFLPPRDRPDWDKNSGFIRRNTDVEVNQSVVRRVKELYESNPVIANAVDIFLREIWRGGISITVHFGAKEKMVFSAQDKLTKQYFSERLNPEMKAALRDCVLYGFACVRVNPPKMVEVEVEEEEEEDIDAYVDEEALRAALPDSRDKLLELLDREIRTGAASASDTLQEKMDTEGSVLRDGKQDLHIGHPIRRLEGSSQLAYDDPDPQTARNLRAREARYREEEPPTVEALKTQLLALRQSNRAVEQMARGEGGGARPERDARKTTALGDDDIDSYPSFTVLDMARVTQYIRLNEEDRREYYVTYNGHHLNRSRQPVPQGMVLVLTAPTLDGLIQSPVTKAIPLVRQLNAVWQNFDLATYRMARPLYIATVETDKSDAHTASRTMTYGDAAQDGTSEAMEKFTQTVEIRRQRMQETHEIVIDDEYENRLQRKEAQRKRQAEGRAQSNVLYGDGGASGGLRDPLASHPLLREVGAEDPLDLRDRPWVRKAVFPANSRMLPNPVPAIPPGMLDVSRYLCEQIFIAMGLPGEMYQGNQGKFATNAALNQMIQGSRIQEFQNAMSTLFQTLLTRVFDPLVDERIYSIATQKNRQDNPRYLRRYKDMANILVEFHFNVHLSDDQLVLYVEQGWLDEKAAQTFALRQASIDPKFGASDPAAARRKRMREVAQDEDKPRTDMERARLQSAEKIAAENRRSAERTARQQAAARASQPAMPRPASDAQPAAKRQK